MATSFSQILHPILSYMTTIPHRHRQTDGRTTCLDNTALRVASRGKKSLKTSKDCLLTLCMIYFIKGAGRAGPGRAGPGRA